MKLSDSDILYLCKQIKTAEQKLEQSSKGAFRYVARAESAVLMINLAGYCFDYDKFAAYKVPQKEEREYVNAKSTDTTNG